MNDGSIIFLIFGFLIFILGFALLIATIRAIVKSISSKKWPATDGVIASSDIEKKKHKYEGSTSSTSTHHFPDIEFTYSIGGKSYTSKKVYFGTKLITFSGYFKSKRLNKKYPEGKQVTVYYNPAKEKEAVLEPGFHSDLVKGFIFSLLFMSLPVIFLAFPRLF